MILQILASACLFYLSFPNIISLNGFSFLAWIFAVPLLFCFEGKSLLGRFLIGVVFGFVSNLAAINWMIPYSFPGYLLLSFVLAFQAAIFAVLYAPRRGRPVWNVIDAAAAWVVSEYLRKILMLGESWNLAHTQAFDIPLIQSANIFGSSGVSFVLIAVNYALYRLLRNSIDKSKQMPEVLVALALVAAVYGYGFFYLAKSAGDTRPPVEVTVLQSAHDYHGDLTDERILKIVEGNIALTKRAAAALQRKPDLIVWPETAVPTDFLRDDVLKAKITGLVKETGSYLLIGTVTDEDNAAVRHNSAVLLNPNGETKKIYHKRHLIPLTEFIPDTMFWKIFAKIFRVQTPALVEGPEKMDGLMEIRLRDGGQTARFGVAICSEDNIDRLFRDYSRRDAQFVVVLLNNGWFTQEAGIVMHAQHSVIRATENHIPVLRAANYGLSALIDGSGRISGTSLETFAGKRFLNVKVQPAGNKKTPYNNLGDTFCVLCAGFVILIRLYPKLRIRK